MWLFHDRKSIPFIITFLLVTVNFGSFWPLTKLATAEVINTRRTKQQATAIVGTVQWKSSNGNNFQTVSNSTRLTEGSLLRLRRGQA